MRYRINARYTISIHALLAESDALPPYDLLQAIGISIHALLAESDRPEFYGIARHTYFYPRSPCGERHRGAYHVKRHENFYPRSPCGERR